MREVSRREALAAGAGIGLVWTGVKYASAWVHTGSLRCMDLVPPVGATRFEYDGVNGLEMRVLDSPVRLGSKANFRLRNTADEVRGTGTEHFYALQQRTETGWTHVLFVPRDAGWPAAATVLEPGGELSWSFEFTRAGFSREPYRACVDLTPGEYRFGYWGVSAQAVPAVRFDVLDNE